LNIAFAREAISFAAQDREQNQGQSKNVSGSQKFGVEKHIGTVAITVDTDFL
jgi:hypothetical protein